MNEGCLVTTKSPACVALVLDLTKSSSDEGDDRLGGNSLVDAIVGFANAMLFDIALTCQRGEDEPRNYIHVGLIGYGSAAGEGWQSLPARLVGTNELWNGRLTELQVPYLEKDEHGNELQMTRVVPVWASPVGSGRTTAAEALSNVAGWLGRWVHEYRHCCAPLVMHCTSALAPLDAAAQSQLERLREIRTDAGELLLAHLVLRDGPASGATSADDAERAGATEVDPRVHFPGSAAGLPPEVGPLFETASPLPPEWTHGEPGEMARALALSEDRDSALRAAWQVWQWVREAWGLSGGSFPTGALPVRRRWFFR